MTRKSTEMSYGEFWVLETALTFGVCFSRIVGSPIGIQNQWNKPYHNVPRWEMLDLLDRLTQDGDIVAAHLDGSIYSPSRDELDVLLDQSPNLEVEAQTWYELTPQGGERWEQFAGPDWSRYHSDDSFYDEHGEIRQVAAMTSLIVERAFRYVCPWSGWKVIIDSVQRDTLQPWKATYWKTLPEAFGIRFRYAEFRDHEEQMAHFYPEMSDPEIQVAERHVVEEYYYFDRWYRPHPETPKFCVS